MLRLPGFRHIVREGTDRAFGAGGDCSRVSLLLQGGSNLILVARRSDPLEKVAEAAKAAHKASGVQQGGTVATIQLDVSDRAQVAALWSKVPQDLRNIDILGTYSLPLPLTASRTDRFGLPPRFTSCAVNNAGSAHGIDHVGDVLDSDIDAMFATNVLGLISITQLLVKGPIYSPGNPPGHVECQHN